MDFRIAPGFLFVCGLIYTTTAAFITNAEKASRMFHIFLLCKTYSVLNISR